MLKIGIEIKQNKMPKATALTAKLVSSLAFITIAAAKVIVGVADSMIATIVLGLKDILKTKMRAQKIKGAKIIFAKITTKVLL